MTKPPNKPGVVNGGSALWFQIEQPWPAETDPERWAAYMKTLKNLARFVMVAAALTINQPAQAGSWVATGSLGTARQLHTATLLPSGKVLIAGGNTVGSSGGITNSVELYDPSAGTWTPAAPMNIARSFHTATLLPNSMVLVTGGIGNGGSTNTAELYDPSVNTWTLIASMTTNRVVHSATLLPNGKVLVAGGFSGNPPAGSFDISDSAEIYDPTAGTWTRTSALNTPRGYHKAALLPNGQVLLAGGSDSAFNPLSSADLFTPATGHWTTTGSMKSPRAGFAMLLLPNGKVLAAGGMVVYDAAGNTAELYDPATGTWTWTTAMANARADNTATLLPDGTALLVDGWGKNGDTPPSELYNPTNGAWSVAAPFSPRFHISATLLPNGKVLAAGGKNADQIIFPTAQLYDTGSGPIAPPTLASPKTLANTPLQLAFTSRYGSVFSVIATRNVAAPLSAWPVIGVATEASPGQFQFTDSQATNLTQRFYRLRSP